MRPRCHADRDTKESTHIGRSITTTQARMEGPCRQHITRVAPVSAESACSPCPHTRRPAAWCAACPAQRTSRAPAQVTKFLHVQAFCTCPSLMLGSCLHINSALLVPSRQLFVHLSWDFKSKASWQWKSLGCLVGHGDAVCGARVSGCDCAPAARIRQPGTWTSSWPAASTPVRNRCTLVRMKPPCTAQQGQMVGQVAWDTSAQPLMTQVCMRVTHQVAHMPQRTTTTIISHQERAKHASLDACKM